MTVIFGYNSPAGSLMICDCMFHALSDNSTSIAKKMSVSKYDLVIGNDSRYSRKGALFSSQCGLFSRNSFMELNGDSKLTHLGRLLSGSGSYINQREFDSVKVLFGEDMDLSNSYEAFNRCITYNDELNDNSHLFLGIFGDCVGMRRMKNGELLQEHEDICVLGSGFHHLNKHGFDMKSRLDELKSLAPGYTTDRSEIDYVYYYFSYYFNKLLGLYPDFYRGFQAVRVDNNYDRGIREVSYREDLEARAFHDHESRNSQYFEVDLFTEKYKYL